VQVIVIPADDSQPCTAQALPDDGWRAALARLAGPVTDRAVYDRDAVVWVDGEGAGALPPNRRATAYVWGHSQAAAQHGTDPASPPYWLHGTVIITGEDSSGLPADAPARLHVIFGTTGAP
jgi:hypothetical protein